MRVVNASREIPKLTEADKERVVKLYLMGYSINKIARYLNVYETRVRGAVLESGVKLRSSSESFKINKTLNKIETSGV